MDKDLQVAKKLFLKYGGSHFQMEREGEYAFYKNLNVNKEQEQAWINEYQRELIEKISCLNEKNEQIVSYISTFFSTIRSFFVLSNLNDMLNILDNKILSLDSYSKYLISKEICDFAEYLLGNNTDLFNISVKLKSLAKKILNNIIKQPISVDDFYAETVYFKEELEKNKIMENAKRMIDCIQMDL